MTRLVAGRRLRVKISKHEIKRRLRLGDLRTLFQDRCRGSILPDDDAGRDYLRELLLPISLGPNEAVRRIGGSVAIWGPADRMRREIEEWAPWMSEDEAGELIEEINLMPPWQRKPMARTLGKRLNVPYGERARLGLRTIGPYDMTEAGMAAIRKQKGRQRDRLRRRLRGIQSRAEYLAASLSQTKPWEALGISRRTYYYRIKNGRCTSPRAINLTTITDCTLVQTVKTGEGSKECGRVATPTPAGQTETHADGFLTADEAAWLVDAMCAPEAAAISRRASTILEAA